MNLKARFIADKQKDFLYFLLVLLLHLLLAALVFTSLYPIHFTPHNLFFLELIGKISFYFPFGVLLILEIGNVVLFWLIGRLLLPKYSIIPPFIYSIAPWGVYSLVLGSFYTYLLFLTLLFFYGLLLIRNNKQLIGNILIGVSVANFIYSSVFGLLLVIILGAILVLKEFTVRKLKISLIILSIVFIPYLFLVVSNTIGFINVFKNETKVFSDPGIINTVNEYQTSSTKKGLQKIAKISENKYIFSSEYIAVKFLKQLIPSTMFTSEGKLGHFSFTPPILLGFLIPFIYGLSQMSKKNSLRRVLILSVILVLPSTLALQGVDLNRLLIFIPTIVILISYGLVVLWTNRRESIHKVLLYMTIFLVIFQFLVTLYDIPLRERNRFNKYFYFEKNFEVSKQ